MINDDTYFTQDGGPEKANIYFSQCISCKHFDRRKKYTCTAFPQGIPNSILYEMKSTTMCFPVKQETAHTKRKINEFST